MNEIEDAALIERWQRAMAAADLVEGTKFMVRDIYNPHLEWKCMYMDGTIMTHSDCFPFQFWELSEIAGRPVQEFLDEHAPE